MKKDFNVFVITLSYCRFMDLWYAWLPVAIAFTSKESKRKFKVDLAAAKENFKSAANVLMSNFFYSLYNIAESDNLLYVNDLTCFGIFFLNFLKVEGIFEKNSDVNIIIKNNIIYKISFWFKRKFFSLLDLNLILPLDISLASALLNRKNKLVSDYKSNHTLDYFLKTPNVFNARLVALDSTVLSLFELINNYNAFLYNIFNLNIFNEVTLYSYNFRLFFHKYYSNKLITLDHFADKFIRDSFIGGICDIYKPFGADLVWLDFVSMYPYIMKNICLGINEPTRITHIENLEDFCFKYPCFVKVKVDCSIDMKFPLIAIRDPLTNKVIQATGKFIATVWGKEILYCLQYYKQFYKFEVIDALYFSEYSTSVFSKYVDDLFNLRLTYSKNNEIRLFGNLFKIMLNSLSGRFATNIVKSETTVLNADEELLFANLNADITYKNTQLLSDDVILLNYINNNLQYDSELEKLKSRIDWTAAITSEARILMQQLKDKVDIYYLDTDALVIKASDLDTLNEFLLTPDTLSLGKLRLVHSISFGIFLAPNTYLFSKNLKENFDQKLFFNNGKLSNAFENLKLIRMYLHELNEHSPLDNHLIYQDIIHDNRYFDIMYDKRAKVYNNENVWIDTSPLCKNS